MEVNEKIKQRGYYKISTHDRLRELPTAYVHAVDSLVKNISSKKSRRVSVCNRTSLELDTRSV